MVFHEKALYSVLNLLSEEDKMPFIHAEIAIEKILNKSGLEAIRPAYVPNIFVTVGNNGSLWYYRQAETMSAFREYLNQ